MRENDTKHKESIEQIDRALKAGKYVIDKLDAECIDELNRRVKVFACVLIGLGVFLSALCFVLYE